MKSYSHLEFEVDYSLQRNNIRESRVMSEVDALEFLKEFDQTNSDQRAIFKSKTSELIKQLRNLSQLTCVTIVSEYNLTSDEGLSLMTLVEAF